MQRAGACTFARAGPPASTTRKWAVDWPRSIGPRSRKWIALRRDMPRETFIDVQYRDLLANPIGEFERVLDAVGLPVTAEDLDAARTWMAKNGRETHPPHDYAPEDFWRNGCGAGRHVPLLSRRIRGQAMTATDAASGLQAGWQSFSRGAGHDPEASCISTSPPTIRSSPASGSQQLAMIAAQAYPILSLTGPSPSSARAIHDPGVSCGNKPGLQLPLCGARWPRELHPVRQPRNFACSSTSYRMPGCSGCTSSLRPLPLASLDIDTLDIASDGSFCVLLAARRPDGYRGDWWPPRRALDLDQYSAGIERLDQGDRWAVRARMPRPVRASRRDSLPRRAQKLEEIGRFVVRYVNALGHMRRALAGMPANTLHLNTWGRVRWFVEPVLPTRAVSSSRITEGAGDRDRDAATSTLLGHRTPRRAFQCTGLDDQADLLERSPGLHQMPTSAFRAVISIADPGVPNWLDPAGHHRGLLQGRWFEADSGPVPTIRRAQPAAVCANTCRARRRASMRSSEACSCAYAAAVRNSGASGELARRVALLAVAAG